MVPDNSLAAAEEDGPAPDQSRLGAAYAQLLETNRSLAREAFAKRGSAAAMALTREHARITELEGALERARSANEDLVAQLGSPRHRLVDGVRDRLLRAVSQASAPMFLLQAENDYSLGPSDTLGAELQRKGGLNRSRVYPPYGSSTQSGHGGFALHGTEVWGADVCAFLSEVNA